MGFLSTYFLLHKVQSAFLQARAMGLLTASKETLPRSARLSLLLARESYLLRPGGEALSQILQALAENPELASIPAPFPAQGGNGLLAVSPEGKFLLLPSSRETLDIWDETGRKLLSIPPEETRLLGEKSGILSLSFSPRGDSFLAAGWDGLCLWNLEGKRLLHLGGPGKENFRHYGRLRQAWFSGNGKKLVLFFRERRASNAALQVRDLGGKVIRTLTIPCRGYAAFGFQPFLGIFWFIPRALPGAGGKVPHLQAWNLKGEAVHLPLSFPHKVEKAGFSRHGRFFGVIFKRFTPKGGSLYGFRVQDREGHVRLERQLSPVKIPRFSFSPDEKRVAYVLGNWTVVIHPLDRGERETAWIAHDQPVCALAFSPDGRHLLTGSQGGEMALWNLRGKKNMNFRGHEAKIRKLGFLGLRACFGFSEDGTVRIWRTRPMGTSFFEIGFETNKPFFFGSPGDTLFLIGPEKRIGKWSPKGKFLGTLSYPGRAPLFLYGDPETGAILVSGRDNRPRLWEEKTQRWFPLPQVRGILIAASFQPGGNRFAVTLARGRGQTRGVFLFSHDGKGPRLLFHREIWGNFLRFSPSGREFLLAGGIDKGLFLLDEKGETILHAFPGRSCRMAAFLDSGKRIAVHAAKSGVFLLDLKGKVLTRFPETPYVNSLQSSPGGRSFLYTSRNGLLLVRDSRGRILLRHKECEGPIRSAAFSPSGRKILEATPKALKILDASSGKVMLSFHTGADIWRAGFTPSGKRAWILFKGGVGLRLLPIEAGAILDFAAQAAGRGFTRAEREAYRTLLGED